jgi:hypothetical protein
MKTKTRIASALLFAGLISALAPTNTMAAPGCRGASVGLGLTPLRCQIVYDHVGALGETDDEGRLLVWEGNITGDITGTVKWWFYQPAPAAPAVFQGGRAVFYGARWEIWDGDKLLLAGESAGKTVIPFAADGTSRTGDGIWDGKGVVTEARGRLRMLKGRHIYETGSVVFPAPLQGAGLFLIY